MNIGRQSISTITLGRFRPPESKQNIEHTSKSQPIFPKKCLLTVSRNFINNPCNGGLIHPGIKDSSWGRISSWGRRISWSSRISTLSRRIFVKKNLFCQEESLLGQEESLLGQKVLGKRNLFLGKKISSLG